MHEILRDHLCSYYQLLADSKTTPQANWERISGLFRVISGMPHPYNNAVIMFENKEPNISAQLNYFDKIPFVWYLNESENPEMKQKLIDRGFKFAGVFQGVIGFLDKPLPTPKVPEGCTLELVKTEEAMEKFNELVCTTFSIEGISKELYKRALWGAAQGEKPRMFHWLARKDGKAISAVSTFIENDKVSFWNGATVPELRRHGLSTALRHFALREAMAKGCRIGISYLMAEGLAYGICKKLGYETKWRFDALLSP